MAYWGNYYFCSLNESLFIMSKQKQNNVVSTMFKAVALAMGVVVVVLSVLDKLEPHAGLTMLGIGMACAGIALFDKE